jgi:hypothetical protein
MPVGIAALLAPVRPLLAFDPIQFLNRIAQSFAVLRAGNWIRFFLAQGTRWGFVAPQFLQSILADAVQGVVGFALLVWSQPNQISVSRVFEIKRAQMQVL